MGVTFGGVTVHCHARVVDGSKLPSDGAAPLGLGRRTSIEEHTSLEEFEKVKRSSRDEVGELVLWFHIPPEMRRRYLLDSDGGSSEEIEAISRENALILRQREREEGESAFAQVEDSGESTSFQRMRPNTDMHRELRYSTAQVGDKREGACGAFSEVQPEETERRKQRAIEAQAQKELRKAERKKCAGCHRFACIC